MEAMMRNWMSNETDKKGGIVVKAMKGRRENIRRSTRINAQDNFTIHDFSFFLKLYWGSCTITSTTLAFRVVRKSRGHIHQTSLL